MRVRFTSARPCIHLFFGTTPFLEPCHIRYFYFYNISCSSVRVRFTSARPCIHLFFGRTPFLRRTFGHILYRTRYTVHTKVHTRRLHKIVILPVNCKLCFANCKLPDCSAHPHQQILPFAHPRFRPPSLVVFTSLLFVVLTLCVSYACSHVITTAVPGTLVTSPKTRIYHSCKRSSKSSTCYFALLRVHVWCVSAKRSAKHT